MKQLLLPALMAFALLSCDPIAQFEANIENTTAQDLSVSFFSTVPELNDTLQINRAQSVLFQEGSDIGSTFIEPSLMDYDSVIVRNVSGEILRVYKPEDTGKNIFGIKEYWSSREPSKRIFVYEYQIENADIE